MSTTIDALRNLGLKVNGTEPVSNYTGNIINEIADNYTGGGSGSGIYTFDYSAATVVHTGETATGEYSWTLPINLATMQELLEQPAISLTLGTAVSNIIDTNHVTVTKGTSDSFSGGCYINQSTENGQLTSAQVATIYFDLTSSAATLALKMQDIPLSSGGGGIQLYKHTIPLNITAEAEETISVSLEIISASSTAITIPNEAALSTASYNFNKMVAEAVSSRIYIIGSGEYQYYDMSYPLLTSVSMGTGSGDPNYPNGYWFINNIAFLDNDNIVSMNGDTTGIALFSDTVTTY